MKYIVLILLAMLPNRFSIEKKEFIISDASNEIDHKELLLESFIMIESSGDSLAVNKTSKATGVLQLMPICVAEANRLLGYSKYRLEDRTSRTKSIEIFHIIMEHKNPTYDIGKACRIWNSRGGISYQRKIEKKYNELLSEKV